MSRYPQPSPSPNPRPNPSPNPTPTIAYPHIKSGANIITQGEFGDNMCFYCLSAGTAVVSVDGKEVALYESGACFGELALLYGSPRAATVTATSDCTLFVIDSKVRGLARLYIKKYKENK